MMIIEEVGALIMWLAVFIGWLIKGCKTNLFKECAKIEDSTKRNVGRIFVIFLIGPFFLGECRGGYFFICYIFDMQFIMFFIGCMLIV